MSAPNPAAAKALRELAESDERLRPTHDHLLVTVESETDRTRGRLYIPDVGRRHETGVGVVVAVGPGRIDPKTGERSEMEITIGDRVAYETFRAINKVILGTATFALIEQRHVLGVLEGKGDVEVRA